jgi:ParB family chromosome partitioning protein
LARRAGRRSNDIPAIVADVASRDASPTRTRRASSATTWIHQLALAFRALADTGATQETIGERVGFERSTIANHLRLLELPRDMQADVEGGAMSIGHAKAILAVASPERRRSLRDRIVRDALSVRQAEELARDLGAAAGAATSRITTVDPDLATSSTCCDSACRPRCGCAALRAAAASRSTVGADELNRLVELVLGAP